MHQIPERLRYLQNLPISDAEQRRITMSIECLDCDGITKVADAGRVNDHAGIPVQVMHNGVLIAKDCYGGPWMTRIISELKGHHEPQEERVFHEVLSSLQAAQSMIELGAYWSYYSLWFLKQFPQAQAIMVEADPQNLEIGRLNFELNRREGLFIQAAVAQAPAPPAPFQCESDGQNHLMRRVSVDSLMEELGMNSVDILLVDVQGAELDALKGMKRSLEQQRIHYVFVSTHASEISGDYLLHQRCLEWIKEHGGSIIAEHTVEESFSGDGLIVASFKPDHCPPVAISYNRAHHSLFGSPLEKLAEQSKHLAHEQQSSKLLRSYLDRHSAAITRQIQLDAAPISALFSNLFHARRFKKLLSERKQKNEAISRLTPFRSNGKTQIVFGLQGSFEVIKDEKCITPTLIQELNWDYATLERVVRMVAAEKGTSLKSATLLDIGANIGMVGLQMLSTRLMKRCIAFEPDPVNSALLWSNIRLNGLENRYELHTCALGSSNGRCSFELSSTNCGDHRVRSRKQDSIGEKYSESSREVIQVPMHRLDTLLDASPKDFTKDIGLCWMDVRGFEGEVIRGGLKHLTKHAWPSIVKFWPYGLERAGMNAKSLSELFGGIWTKFAVLEEQNDELWYPLAHIESLWVSVGTGGEHVNLLLMK